MYIKLPVQQLQTEKYTSFSGYIFHVFTKFLAQKQLIHMDKSCTRFGVYNSSESYINGKKKFRHLVALQICRHSIDILSRVCREKRFSTYTFYWCTSIRDSKLFEKDQLIFAISFKRILSVSVQFPCQISTCGSYKAEATVSGNT
jgi:hypothetical protein